MNPAGSERRDDELMRRAAGLARDVEPARDLWPGIAAAIAETAEPAAASRRPRRFAQAAAVLLLVGASSGLTWLAMREDASVTPVAQSGAGSGPVLRPVADAFGSRYTLGPDFRDARQNLSSRLEDKLAQLDPQTRAEVIRNMETIREAIAALNAALDEEPDNLLLQQLLLSTYNKELAVMRRVDGLTRSVMRRNDI